MISKPIWKQFLFSSSFFKVTITERCFDSISKLPESFIICIRQGKLIEKGICGLKQKSSSKSLFIVSFNWFACMFSKDVIHTTA